MNMISLKCPSCNSTLVISEGRDVLFCEYCGHKILMNNDIKYTYHEINEAEIKKQEVKEAIRLEELKNQRVVEENKKEKLEIIFTTIIIIAGLAVSAFIFYLIATHPR